MTLPVIHRVSTLDAGFKAKQREKPIWNGRVLLGRNPVFTAERFSASYFATDFSSFLAWRDWGFPDPTVFNGFGMGALRCADGVFVLGEMGQHTANAGRVYFPSGTPDLDDVSGDTVDIAGSVAREVEEETGLTAADYHADGHWYCVISGAVIAIIRILEVAVSGEALRARIEANLARQAEPELSAIHLVREPSELTAAMPRFVTAFLQAQMGA